MQKKPLKIVDARGLAEKIRAIRNTDEEVSFAACYELDEDGAVLESNTGDWWGAKFMGAFNGSYLLIGAFGGGDWYTFDDSSDITDDSLQFAIQELFKRIATKEVCVREGRIEPTPCNAPLIQTQETLTATQALLEIQLARENIVEVVNSRFDNIIARLKVPDVASNLADKNKAVHGSYAIPIAFNPAIFNNRKPVAVLFNDERIYAKSWRDVLHAILTRCCQDPIYCERLMDLKGKAVGKSRILLSDNPDEVVKPMMIVEGLHVDVHQGASALMGMLVNKLLKTIGFDYSNLFIEVR
ncbi:MAG: hypothetical protein FWB87_15750 [Defluviitaleaceae bacterium]|nr:hypothetical protein [Defluviitaleaceae bacterium]